jgi:hypothetical protein
MLLKIFIFVVSLLEILFFISTYNFFFLQMSKIAGSRSSRLLNGSGQTTLTSGSLEQGTVSRTVPWQPGYFRHFMITLRTLQLQGPPHLKPQLLLQEALFQSQLLQKTYPSLVRLHSREDKPVWSLDDSCSYSHSRWEREHLLSTSARNQWLVD